MNTLSDEKIPEMSILLEFLDDRPFKLLSY